MVLEEAKILGKPIILTDTAARECAKGYSKAIILENTEEGILKGLKKELKSDSIKYLEKTQSDLQNEESEEIIIRKIKGII